MMRFTFSKNEKLKSLKTISRLFKEGESIFVYPIKLIYLPIDRELSPVLFTASVPRKKFRKAVMRNTLKRRMREAYRLNKHLITEPLIDSNQSLAIMAVFIAESAVDYEVIELATKKILTRLATDLNSG